jgi:hypothetical protein
MADEPVIYRREATAALLAIYDIRDDVASILDILREDDDEEAPEDDA